MSSEFIGAIRESHVERVAAYLLAGVDPNFTEDNDNVTPLHHAAQFPNKDIVEMLLIAGADIFSETVYDELTPIEVACLNENWVVANLLSDYQQYVYTMAQFLLYQSSL